MIYRFGAFELDASQYRLSRDQTAVPIKPAVLELLVHLIEHRERVVPKQELFAELWGGRFVSDGVLAAAVYEARRALGEDAATGEFIRTLHGRGYQFDFRPVTMIAPEDRAPAGPSMDRYLAWAGGPTPLRDGENVIGRDPSSVIVLDALRVSRHHARILVGEEAAVLEDLGSKNGTLLNGRAVTAATPLAEGDAIEIGGVVLIFRSRLGDLSTMTQQAEPPS